MCKKKPTVHNVKQGQTVYMISGWPCSYGYHFTMEKYFIYGKRVAPPEEGCIIEQMSITLLEGILERFGNEGIHFSRRKAETELKRRRAE